MEDIEIARNTKLEKITEIAIDNDIKNLFDMIKFLLIK